MLCDAGAAAAAERPQPLLLPLIEMMQSCDTQQPSTLGTHHGHLPATPVIRSIYMMYISTVNSWHNNKHNLSLVVSGQYCGVQLSI